MPCTKTRTLNKAVANHLPGSNDQIALCLRNYTKMILNMKPKGDKHPNPPNENELRVIEIINPTEPTSNTSFFQINSSDVELYGGKKSIPRKYKERCQKELQHYGILVPTFQWDTKGITPYDNLVLKVIVKHWMHAKSEGAFSSYAIDAEHSRYEILFGLSERWLRGQKDVFKKPRLSKTASKSRMKHKIFKHRVSTAKQYWGTKLARSLLPSIECCSDTEEDSDGVYHSISLPWRSSLYSQFLHNLDNNTLNNLSEMSGICEAKTSVEYHRKHGTKAPKHNSNPWQKLPSNCYCSTYLNSLSCTEKLIIDIQKPEDNLADMTYSLDRTCWFD